MQNKATQNKQNKNKNKIKNPHQKHNKQIHTTEASRQGVPKPSGEQEQWTQRRNYKKKKKNSNKKKENQDLSFRFLPICITTTK